MMSCEPRGTRKLGFTGQSTVEEGATERMLGICRGSSWSLQLSTNEHIFVKGIPSGSDDIESA